MGGGIPPTNRRPPWIGRVCAPNSVTSSQITGLVCCRSVFSEISTTNVRWADWSGGEGNGRDRTAAHFPQKRVGGSQRFCFFVGVFGRLSFWIVASAVRCRRSRIRGTTAARCRMIETASPPGAFWLLRDSRFLRATRLFRMAGRWWGGLTSAFARIQVPAGRIPRHREIGADAVAGRGLFPRAKPLFKIELSQPVICGDRRSRA